MTDRDSLISGSLREFIDRVASADAPVPAGGSVVALTGAASAALLVLVCGVLERSGTARLGDVLAQAEALQQHLLSLVDADAAAFRAFLDDKHSPAAIDQASQTPLQIASACGAVIDLSDTVEGHTTGPMLGDVRAARHLALAGLQAALDIAEQDVVLHTDPQARQHLREQIAALRRRR